MGDTLIGYVTTAYILAIKIGVTYLPSHFLMVYIILETCEWIIISFYLWHN